ncbi:MAG: PIG-L family deacetylase [Comamonadaceae bacterium]|nr:PIG-L family deacetylase [Comamonadaceae bacterium]
MDPGMQQLGFEVIGYDYRSHDNYEKDLREIVRKKKPDYVFTLKGEKFLLFSLQTSNKRVAKLSSG